ncbi:preprotein translocase subunit SecY [Candidatus Viadribacter manganicus]|uniref:Protein translocase subunit SecY n=1 Tax=Candidatus Viadribacter manganicus TaxID=1759059 RepID=A0A1B1AMP6_9PROT|nr:preprotein translocase subunit SecY [Candidatus Viadribacter manganicus]ANP47826.1 preprotein translocase subunit SecY [Candidatus Viadribacter manganicus]
MASAAEQLAANINFAAFAKATELQKRIWYTIIALIVYRIGTFIPIPGIDPAAFAQAFQTQAGGILGMFNTFSGGAVERMAIFALNVMPYISSSIIMQLLSTSIPSLERLKKEGEVGRKQINQYTRYLTLVLAIVQSYGIAVGLQSSAGVVTNPGWFFVASTVITLTGGTMFLMWLGEQVTARGVGNGISLIIFAGIVAEMPRIVMQSLALARTGDVNPFGLFMIAAAMLAVIVFVVFIERSQRRLVVQYPKRQQGNRMFMGESSFLPLKINTAGVIPPIFASSLLMLPTTVIGFMGMGANAPEWVSQLQGFIGYGQPGHMMLYAVGIIFFCFFYTSIVFNPEETADNLRKYGGFLPGIRPGKKTAEYLDYVLTRLTVIGAAYITAVCLLPEILIAYYAVPFYLGGTSILIVISVTLDTVAQIQSHLVAHQYEGLIKRSKLRGSGGGITKK